MIEYHKIWISRPLGGWRWANTRGVYRVVAYDPHLHRIAVKAGRSKASPESTIRHGAERGLPWVWTEWESGECTRDYPGGNYGYEYYSRRADEVLESLRKQAVDA